MAELFIKVLNMSISACWMILAVICLRFALKKAPKWVRVLLWGLVAVRLLCPFSIESAFSLIPSAETISPEIMLDATPTVATGITAIDAVVNPAIIRSSAPDPTNSVNPLQIWFAVAGIIWVIGVAVMLAYTTVSYTLLRRKVATAVKIRDGLYQGENVASPFVLGIVVPRIYLPFHISEQNLEHVIAHEQVHIRRKDHWWKPLGFLLLTVHWFNPLAWLAYILLSRDIELACDEKVIKELGTDARADYSAALLSCSVKRSTIAACPIAFGEVSVKTRIKSVLSYKKPAFWVSIIAMILCVIVAVCFLTDPIDSSSVPDFSFLNYENAISLISDRETVQAIYCPPSRRNANNMIQLGVADGTELAAYLDQQNWKETSRPIESLSSLGSVEFVIEDEYRITVYDRKGLSLRQYAVVSYLDEERYYSIQRKDYEDAVKLIRSSESNETSKPAMGMIVSADGYYHAISREGIAELKIEGPNFSGGCVPSDGSTFHIGEKVWLEPLQNITQLRDVMLYALDAEGNVLYSFSLDADTPEMGDAVNGTEFTDTGFVANFAGNTSMDQKLILTENAAQWKITVVNEGTATIKMEIGGVVYSTKPGKTNVVCSSKAWDPGTYHVSFSTAPGQGMVGYAVCEVYSQLTDTEESERYYLTIGDAGVIRVVYSMPDLDGSLESDEGSVIQKGQRIWLEELDGYADLRGLQIRAEDENGEILWSASVPDTEENSGFTHLKNNAWEITNLP